MKNIFNKLTAVALATTIIGGGLAFSTSASELETTETNADGVTEVRSATSGDGARASWGEGILKTENPWGSKPSAYSQTKTFSGTAYKLETQAFSNNDGLGTTSSTKGVATNDSSVQCGGVVSKTEKTVFTGKHAIRDTSSSGWQYADTRYEY